MNACCNTRDKLQILLMAETGLRIGELLGIGYDQDIDFENKTICVKFRENNVNEARAKNKENRIVQMSEETYNVLVKYISENASHLKEGHFLFVNIKNKTTGQAQKVQSVMAQLRNNILRLMVHLLMRWNS